MKLVERSHFSFGDSGKTPVVVFSATQQKACLSSSEQTTLHVIPSSVLQELLGVCKETTSSLLYD